MSTEALHTAVAENGKISVNIRRFKEMEREDERERDEGRGKERRRRRGRM